MIEQARHRETTADLVCPNGGLRLGRIYATTGPGLNPKSLKRASATWISPEDKSRSTAGHSPVCDATHAVSSPTGAT